MAELTVDGLGELTSPAANDEIGIWDVSAGQYLKIRRDTLVGGVITGGGTVATGGFTLTVPATGTAALVTRGSWTPILLGADSSPTAAYSTQVGSYERIGNLVYVSFYLQTSSISGGAGGLLIGGLPFTHKVGWGLDSVGSCSMRLDWSESKTTFVCIIPSSSTYMYIMQQQDNTEPIWIPVASWGATSFVQGSMVYATN